MDKERIKEAVTDTLNRVAADSYEEFILELKNQLLFRRISGTIDEETEKAVLEAIREFNERVGS
jgi:hypothetical protein